MPVASGPPTEISPPLPLPCRFGRYRLTHLIATGGMAQIYLAKAFGAEGFVKPMVIKRLDPRLARTHYFTSLFVNEAKLLVSLNHGNIVPVFDFGRIKDDLFMAMEYIPGPSLRQLLHAVSAVGQRLDHQLAAHVAAEICKGLDYAHRKNDAHGQPAGIVHRDIKPTNVLVSTEGEVKIVDFGVAKLAGRMERRGQMAGTLAYMSPEQASGLTVDHRTDIFSTGLVLYELLTNQRAYGSDTPREVLAAARKASIPPIPGELALPPQLHAILRRALALRTSERYSSAHEMEQELSEYLLVARSSAEVDVTSPASRLSELMKSLRLDEALRNELGPLDLSDEPAEQELSLADLKEVSPGSSDEPPDVDLIRGAAETFHSEFMTRVLQEAEGGTRRRWALLLGGAGLGLLLGVAALLIFARPGPTRQARDSGASPRRVAASVREAGPRVSAPDARGRNAARESSPTAVPVEKTGPGPRARPGHGYLNVNSVPWSNVTIDGRPQGRPTPLLRIKLAAGKHTLVLTNRERNLRKTVEVVIRRGATTNKVVQLAGPK